MNPISRPSRRLSRRALLAAGAAALVAVTVACTPTTEVTVAGAAQNTQGIAVAGQGSVSVRPDIAELNLGVEVTALTVAEARGRAADAMASVQAAITGLGVAEEDIQTRYFNIYPQYSYPEREAPQITGFVVTNQSQVKVRDMDNVSAVLDAAVEAGGDAVRVNGISFTVEDPEAFLADARTQAVNNARDRAQVLADAAGVELGAPLSINEAASFPGPYPEFVRQAQDGGGSSASTPLNPGEQELTVSVSVVYSIQD
ncbi:MAG: SIMPL domain-containing protein [Dehalococcoidia bacterium]|nr:SIMPL domain-containing protein [Dehalococcoidia bacterium]